MSGVLIADDSSITRSALVRTVARERPELTPLVEAASAAEAMAAARSLGPAVVLLEIELGGFEGLRVCAEIRRELPATRVILLTAHEEFAYAGREHAAGGAPCLLKPARPAQLIAAIDAQLAALGREAALRAGEAPVAGGPPMAALALQPGGTPLVRALAYMQGNLHRADLSLGEVARAACLSPSHLAALMRRKVGRSYSGYLAQSRIERARQLLGTTDLTVAAVAEAVGYQTPAHFYRRFKAAVGLTPMAFRNSLLG